MKKRILQARSALIRFVRGVVGGPGMDWTTDKALGRGSRRHQIATIVDVGASNGIWTMRARRHFPEARALLIEAQGAVHRDALEAYARRDPRINYVIAAAGDNAGDIHFEASDPFGGAAAREPFAGNDIVVPMTTIDLEVASRDLPGPYLVKLDTHGFETQILAGGTQVLREAAIVIIESYNFELRPGVLRFHELCAHMEGLGFRCTDLADPMRRPKDELLWQMDLFFERADGRLFADNNYA